MTKITKKSIHKNGIIPHCNYGKLLAIFKLSNEELISIIQMKESNDFYGIKNFFTSQNEFCLHYVNFEILDNKNTLMKEKECHLLLFSPHAYLAKKVITVIIGSYVFEFVPKFGCKEFFIGGVTNTLYAICGLLNDDVKPIKISITQ